MDLQSRLAELSSVRGLGRCSQGSSDPGVALRRAPPCALSAGRALRPASRRLQAPGEGRFELSGLDCYRPGLPAIAEPRNDRTGLRGYLSFLGSSTVGDWVTVPDDCSL